MKSVLVALALLCHFTVFTQTYSISGVVIDDNSAEPVSGVQLLLRGTSLGTQTKSRGDFVINNVPEGEYLLELHALGYAIESIDLVVYQNQTGLTILLTKAPVELSTILITGKASQTQPFQVENIQKEQIDKIPAQDVGNLLTQLPNVGAVKKGVSGQDPVVRGFKYSQLNVVLDGGMHVEGGCPNRMDPALAHIDVLDIENISVIKGPFEFKYGPTMGGVIPVETFKISEYEKFETHISANFGLQSNGPGGNGGGELSGGNSDFQFDLGGNYRSYGDYSDGQGAEIPSEMERYNVKGRLAWTPGMNHYLGITVNESRGINIRFPSLPMDERSDETGLYALDYKTTFENRLLNKLEAKVYLSDVHHTMDNKQRPFSDTVVSISKISALSSGGRMQLTFHAQAVKWLAGIDYRHTYKDGNREKNFILQAGLPQKQETLWHHASIDNYGGFVEYHRNHKKWELMLAARIDLNEAGSLALESFSNRGDTLYFNNQTSSAFVNFSLQAAWKYFLNDQTELSVAVGRGTRSPDLTERFIVLLPIGYDRYDYLGNPKLLPEVNHEIDAGIHFQNRKFGDIQFNGFYSYVLNFIGGSYIPPGQLKPNTPGVLGVKEFVNLQPVSLTGFGFSYASPAASNWQLRAQASYTYGWVSEITYTLIEEGAVSATETASPDALAEIPPFDAKLSLSYKLCKRKFYLEWVSRFVAAQNHVSLAQHETATPGFAVHHLNFTYYFSPAVQIHGGVMNVFNRFYYEHLNRNIIGSQQPLAEMGRNFFINLAIKI